MDPDRTLEEFKCQFNLVLKQIPGFSDSSTDDFPSVISIDEPIWNNNEDKHHRRDALAKVKLEVMAFLRPTRIKFSDQVRQAGDCCHPGCPRNRSDYNGGSCFQGSHVHADGKRAHPCELALFTDGRLQHEMKSLGIDDVCRCHHDYAAEKRSFDLDKLKNFKLIPLPKPERGEGKNILHELMNDDVFQDKIVCVIMEYYINGWSTMSPPTYGDYNTLRLVIDAYFERFADDYTIPNAEQWNDANLSNRSEFFRETFRYILQDMCGVCGAATAPGTKEAAKKSPEDMTEGDFACLRRDFDLRNMPVKERQSVEADHNIATLKGKLVSRAPNILDMIDELCHTIYLCYFCHKKRTANQQKKNSWSNGDRDYTLK